MKKIFTAVALLTSAFSQNLTLAQGQASSIVFDPANVTEISWSAGAQTLKLKSQNKKSPFWTKISGPAEIQPDDWNIHRRLAILSNAENTEVLSLPNPATGGVILKLTGGKTVEGEFSAEGFRWKTGAAQGKGYAFSKHPEIKDLFDEGLRSISTHELQVCTPAKVTSFESISPSWSFVKTKNKWIVAQQAPQSSENPAHASVIDEFLKNFCRLKVDHFLVGIPEISKGKPTFKFAEGRKENQVVEAGTDQFKFTNSPAFTSKSFTEILKITADDFKDSSLEEGRIALDPQKSEKERIQAIRTMKANGSPVAIPALKAIVNEKTEIDLYRYEAVDALAAIGTKEAYKIIADRLAEIGRSGFELRLARALALGLGHNFVSDEKTPEPQRRAEVQDLLAFYRSHGDKVHSSEK